MNSRQQDKGRNRRPDGDLPRLVIWSVSGLLILTTVLFLVQPYDARNVPVFGRWPYSYFWVSISFALVGALLLLVSRLHGKVMGVNLAMAVMGCTDSRGISPIRSSARIWRSPTFAPFESVFPTRYLGF